MEWKNLTIIPLLILIGIETTSSRENLEAKSVCSFKRITCLSETSFKFCFSTGLNTYLYGETKNCPLGTICNEYEGINACIEYRSSLDIHDHNKTEEDTAYSTISMLPESITRVQLVESTSKWKWFIQETNQSTYNYPPSTVMVTDTSIPETMSMASDILSTIPQNSPNQSIIVTPETSNFAMNYQSTDTPKTENIFDIPAKLSSNLPIAISSTVSPSSRYSTDQNEFEFTRPIRTVSHVSEKTTPSTHVYSSKVTKRKRKHHKKRRKKPSTDMSHFSTISSQISSISVPILISTDRSISSTTPENQSSLDTPLSIVVTKSPVLYTHIHPPSATTSSDDIFETTSPISTIQASSSKVTKRRRNSTTRKHNNKVKKRKPSTSTVTHLSTTSNEIKSSDNSAQKAATQATKFVRISSNSPRIKFPIALHTTQIIPALTSAVTNIFLSQKVSSEDTSISTKDHIGTAISTESSVRNISSTTRFFAPTNATTLSLCQKYLLELLSKTTQVTEADVANPIKIIDVTVEDFQQTEVTDPTPPAVCKSAGKYPSKNCNEYYECLKVMWWYRLMYRKCRKRERFDHRTLQCVSDVTCH